ncbi:eamA-like transporter family protein, partial [Vibrio parahaemolyticus AQ3810]
RSSCFCLLRCSLKPCKCNGNWSLF